MASRPEETCPHCGESFRTGRKSCPHCGSDAETGWLPADAQDAAVELPSTGLTDEGYGAFLASEGLAEPRAAPGVSRRGPLPMTAIILLVLLAAAFLLITLR